MNTAVRQDPTETGPLRWVYLRQKCISNTLVRKNLTDARRLERKVIRAGYMGGSAFILP
jgi:hypothetical protein